MAVSDQDKGLVIFIRRIPKQVSLSYLQSRLEPHLSSVGIRSNEFDLYKPKLKGVATLYVESSVKGENFLVKMKQYPSTLNLSRFVVLFERDANQDGGAMLKDRKFIEKINAEAYKPTTLDDQMNGKVT
jgi:hypothetical protein